MTTASKSARFAQLAWWYLIYIEIPSTPEKLCAREFNFAQCEKLLAEYPLLCKNFSTDDFRAFSHDVQWFMNYAVLKEDDHDSCPLMLELERRGEIAYAFIVARTSKKFWWLGEIHKHQIIQFSNVQKIRVKESRAFFKRLVADLFRLHPELRKLKTAL